MDSRGLLDRHSCYSHFEPNQQGRAQKKRRLLCPVLLIEFLPRRAIRKTKTGRSEKHSANLKSPSGSRCKRAYCCTAPLTYEFLIPCAKFLCMNKKVAKKSSNNIFGKQQYVDYGKKAHHPRKLSAAREGHHNKKPTSHRIAGAT